jgi:putative FmdB family regulatory protein
MPIYEYRCSQCGKKSEIITFRISESVAATCRHCGSDLVDRIPSRVRVRLSEETRMERLADPSRLGGLDENDPKSMIRWMKKMGQEMGDDLGGEDMDSMIEEAMEEEAKGKAGESESLPGDDL